MPTFRARPTKIQMRNQRRGRQESKETTSVQDPLRQHQAVEARQEERREFLVAQLIWHLIQNHSVARLVERLKQEQLPKKSIVQNVPNFEIAHRKAK